MSKETRTKHQEEVIGWYPTSQEFDAYLAREVEMAKVNLGGNCLLINLPTNLHSHETCMKVLEMCRAKSV